MWENFKMFIEYDSIFKEKELYTLCESTKFVPLPPNPNGYVYHISHIYQLNTSYIFSWLLYSKG